eukprot:6713185-Prorocentrum_lima.AAC.1
MKNANSEIVWSLRHLSQSKAADLSNSFLHAALGSSSSTADDQPHLGGAIDEIMEKGEEEAKRKRG